MTKYYVYFIHDTPKNRELLANEGMMWPGWIQMSGGVIWSRPDERPTLFEGPTTVPQIMESVFPAVTYERQVLGDS